MSDCSPRSRGSGTSPRCTPTTPRWTFRATRSRCVSPTCSSVTGRSRGWRSRSSRGPWRWRPSGRCRSMTLRPQERPPRPDRWFRRQSNSRPVGPDRCPPGPDGPPPGPDRCPPGPDKPAVGPDGPPAVSGSGLVRVTRTAVPRTSRSSRCCCSPMRYSSAPGTRRRSSSVLPPRPGSPPAASTGGSPACSAPVQPRRGSPESPSASGWRCSMSSAGDARGYRCSRRRDSRSRCLRCPSSPSSPTYGCAPDGGTPTPGRCGSAGTGTSTGPGWDGGRPGMGPSTRRSPRRGPGSGVVRWPPWSSA